MSDNTPGLPQPPRTYPPAVPMRQAPTPSQKPSDKKETKEERRKRLQIERWQRLLHTGDRIINEYAAKKVILSDAYMWGLSGMLTNMDFMFETVMGEYITRLLERGHVYKYGDEVSMMERVYSHGCITIEEYNNGLALALVRNFPGVVCRYMASHYPVNSEGLWMRDPQTIGQQNDGQCIDICRNIEGVDKGIHVWPHYPNVMNEHDKIYSACGEWI